MSVKRICSMILALFVLSVGTISLMSGCSGSSEESQDVVYDDMKEAFEQSGLLSANIGIFSKTESDGNISYGEGGSGVIFKKDGNNYYALTAAHVVSVDGAQLLVYTTNTEMKTEEIPGLDMIVLTPDTYDSMYKAEKVYVSNRDDLAIIKFTSDEELAVISIAEEDPQIDDRIMCIGNPQNEWFKITYGKVTSGIDKYGESQGFPSNAMKHSAYINVGSSGGAAINEKMQLVGTTPGANLSADGEKVVYGLMIPVSEIRQCLDEWEYGK